MPMITILIIDDDVKLTKPLEHQLTALGFVVHVADEGRTGLGMVMVDKPDVIILDIMLPNLDGWQVCQEIRRFSQVPIIMLTALGTEIDRIRGLELGADDYLSKPFSMQELVARIRAMVRRVQWDREETSTPELKIGDIRVQNDTHRVFKGEEELILRNKEYDLLLTLMLERGRIVTRETLFNTIWGTDWLGDTRTLDVHIRWLRQKIEADPSNPVYLQTIRSVGYRFIGDEELSS